jgi:hypothetical protein
MGFDFHNLLSTGLNSAGQRKMYWLTLSIPKAYFPRFRDLKVALNKIMNYS